LKFRRQVVRAFTVVGLQSVESEPTKNKSATLEYSTAGANARVVVAGRWGFFISFVSAATDHFAPPPTPPTNALAASSKTPNESMHNEFVVHTTGHELKGLSAVYEYLDAKVPGARVLAGCRGGSEGQGRSQLGCP
jgi:hypothetical protein